MKSTVRKELYVKAPDERTGDSRSQGYVNGTGLKRVERRSLQRDSDWSHANFERYSDDNGRTWGEWWDVHSRGCETQGDGEQLQLSNFSLLLDRETGLIELYLVKLGQRKASTWRADCWRYFIDVTGKMAYA